MFTDEEGKEIWWQQIREIFLQISRAFRRAADFMTDCCHSRSISVVGCVSFVICNTHTHTHTHTLHPTGRFWALSYVSVVSSPRCWSRISAHFPWNQRCIVGNKGWGVHKCKPDPVIRVRASPMTLIDGMSHINRVTAEDSRSTQTQGAQRRSRLWTSSGK